MFLSKDNVVKIGDFGISKDMNNQTDALAKTACGTPYFMAPEVCRHEPYNEKADIWAIGCILYELAFLKKPFNSDTISGLFPMIIHQPLDPIPQDTDTDIRMLVLAMLDKDPVKRPSIWDLANIPCIFNRINSLVEEKQCQAQVACIFEYKAVKDSEKQEPT